MVYVNNLITADVEQPRFLDVKLKNHTCTGILAIYRPPADHNIDNLLPH